MTRDVLVHTAMGELDAQTVSSFLEANGIACEIRGESLRKTHGLTLDGLGEARVYVAASDAAEARRLLEQVASGELELSTPDAPDAPGDDDDESRGNR